MKKSQKGKTTKVKVATKTVAKFHNNKDLNKVLVLLKEASKSEKATFTKKQKISFATKIASEVSL